MQVPPIVTKPTRALAPLAAVGAPSFGWEATVGVLAVVLTGTACLLAVLRWFSRLTPKQRHDVIALIRVWRGTGRPGRPDEAPPDAPADE